MYRVVSRLAALRTEVAPDRPSGIRTRDPQLPPVDRTKYFGRVDRERPRRPKRRRSGFPEGRSGATSVLRAASLLTTLYIFPASLLRPVGGWMSDRWGATGVLWACSP